MRGHALTLEAIGDELPTSFRIFRAGLNTTANGYDVLFDEQAAAQVMAAFEKRGVDMMIDLNHLSLDSKSQSYDPDARGWCRLAVIDGELWAVDVKWTDDGADRLRRKAQRYVSPAFWLDSESRLVEVNNIAIVANPGTDHAAPLVAASRKTTEETMSLSINVLKANGRKVLAALSQRSTIKTLEEGGTEGGEVAGVDIGELAAFLDVQAAPASDPAGFIAELKAKLGEILGKLDAPAQEEPPAAEPTDTVETMQAVAANRVIRKMLDASSDDDAIVTLASWKQLALEHREKLAAVERDRKALEDTKRRALTARLVACRAETPATAWRDDAKTLPAKHLEAMSLEALEARAKDFEALNGTRAPLVPASNEPGSVLSARELAMCAEMKLDPKEYAATKARRDALRAGKEI